MKNRKQKKSLFEKMSPTYGGFQQHVKRAHLLTLIFNKENRAVTEMENPEHFRWKFYGTHYMTIVTDNRIAPDTVTSFASCNCKGNIFYLYLWRG